MRLDVLYSATNLTGVAETKNKKQNIILYEKKFAKQKIMIFVYVVGRHRRYVLVNFNDWTETGTLSFLPFGRYTTSTKKPIQKSTKYYQRSR